MMDDDTPGDLESASGMLLAAVVLLWLVLVVSGLAAVAESLVDAIR